MVEKLVKIAESAPALEDVKLRFSDYNQRMPGSIYNRATDYDCDSCECDACDSCDCNVCNL